MTQVYDTDKQADYEALKKLVNTTPVRHQVYPRQSVYGTASAYDVGLEPVEAIPDVLLQPDQYVDAMQESHDNQTMPVYHMHTWRPEGTRWNQNGLGYCWTWSGTGCVMTTRALEAKDTVMLAPVSMGYLTGWANRGNYLESFIKGAKNDGICPAVAGDFNSHKNSRSYWDQHDTDRPKYKLAEVWDTRRDAMVQHCHSILHYGRSLYAAWNHLSHAMEVVGIRYNNGRREWQISNSHNEDSYIIMTGSRATPSEAYGFISTVLR